MYLDNRVGVLRQNEPVLYVNDKQYSAVLINPVIQLRQNPNKDSRDTIRLNEVVLRLYLGYTKLGREVVYALPGIDTPQPDRNKIPPDMVPTPDTPPAKKDRAPLRMPWNPDKTHKKRDNPKKKPVH